MNIIILKRSLLGPDFYHASHGSDVRLAVTPFQCFVSKHTIRRFTQ